MDEWTEGTFEMDEDTELWLRSRPLVIAAMMFRFPPSCIVTANRPLRCPAPNTFGIVSSYVEPSEKHPDGLITVRQHPESEIRASCDPSWLNLVGFYKGITPAVVRGWYEDLSLKLAQSSKEIH